MADLFGATAPEVITTAMKIAEIERELKYRRFVYSNRVAKGEMKQSVADRQTKIMEAILADYQQGRTGA